jgi:uncharacterized protein
MVFISISAVIAQKKHPREIIDTHFHAMSFNSFGFPPPPNEMTGKTPKSKSDSEVLQTMLGELEDNNIVLAIASGTLQRVKDYKRADPERIYNAILIGLSNPLPDTARFIQLIKDGTIQVFGELLIQYEGKTLADSSMEPYLTICERLNIPVAIHASLGPSGITNIFPKFRTSLGNPQLFEDVLVKHPKLKVQLMHMGYPYLEETKAILQNYKQVYVDIAVVDWVDPVNEFYNYLKALIDAGFENRIMYGSDQGVWEDAIPLSIKNVENAPFLSEREKDDIFYNNAVRFFNFDPVLLKHN